MANDGKRPRRLGGTCSEKKMLIDRNNMKQCSPKCHGLFAIAFANWSLEENILQALHGYPSNNIQDCQHPQQVEFSIHLALSSAATTKIPP